MKLLDLVNDDVVDIADIDIVRHEDLPDGTKLDPTYVIHLDNMTNAHVLGIRIEVSDDWLAESLYDEWPRWGYDEIQDLRRRAWTEGGDQGQK